LAKLMSTNRYTKETMHTCRVQPSEEWLMRPRATPVHKYSSIMEVHGCHSALIISAAFSAIATTVPMGCTLICDGNTDASTMRRPLTPCTFSSGFTTPVAGVWLILADDTWGVRHVSITGDARSTDPRGGMRSEHVHARSL
jgi:hypothetical protein